MTDRSPAEPIPVPGPGAEYWGDIDLFALTYNGYDRHGGLDGTAAVNRSLRSQWDEAATLPDDLGLLRCALFFEQRRWRHLDAHPEGEDLAFIEALVDRIRALSGGTVPGPPDPYP